MHRERRKFYRTALKEMALIMTDQPGLLGPKVRIIWKHYFMASLNIWTYQISMYFFRLCMSLWDCVTPEMKWFGLSGIMITLPSTKASLKRRKIWRIDNFQSYSFTWRNYVVRLSFLMSFILQSATYYVHLLHGICGVGLTLRISDQ